VTWHPGASTGPQVGTVAGLWRYPVKSMAGEALAEAEIGWTGVAGDRRWAFLRADSSGSGFPWHTQRENPAMANYVPRLTEPGRPDKSAVEVRAPDGTTYDLAAPALAGELGAGLRLMRLDRGTFDAMPVSLISTATVSALCSLAGVPASELRFRPNLVISLADGGPYAEDNWAGCSVRIGEAVVRIDRRDSRCVVVNVDPDTGQRSGDLLKVIGRHRGARAGVYSSTVTPGLVRLGDPVTLVAAVPTTTATTTRAAATRTRAAAGSPPS
jgi:uncharacterized protein